MYANNIFTNIKNKLNVLIYLNTHLNKLFKLLHKTISSNSTHRVIFQYFFLACILLFVTPH